MKVIIVEGIDNCGKDTLIKNLIKHKFKNSVVLHAGIPNSNNLFKFYYDGLIHNTLNAYYNSNADAVIHNRSMYGEYVYGPKYRNENKSDIVNLIYKLESGQLNTFIQKNELYFILLTSDNPEFIAHNDDGLSLSNKVDDIVDEINSFNEIYELSNIHNKKRIIVNDGNVFKNDLDIYNEVILFINKEN